MLYGRIQKNPFTLVFLPVLLLAAGQVSAAEQVDEDSRALVMNLTRAVENPNSDVDIAEAADAISGSDARRLAVQRLAALWDVEESIVAVRAARALGQFPDQASRVVPHLTAALQSGTVDVQEAAAWALAELSIEAASATPLLVKAVQSDEFGLQLAAITALGRIGPTAKAALPVLRRALHNDDTAREAVTALGQLGAAAVPATADLVALTNSGPADLRSLACEALGEVGDSSAKTLDALNAGTREANELIRLASAFALVRLGEYRDTTAESVARKLGDAALSDDFDVKIRAIVMLGKLGAVAEPAASALTVALQDDSAAVRAASCEALSQMGLAAEAALPALEVALEDESVYVRRTARRAIDRLGEGD